MFRPPFFVSIIVLFLAILPFQNCGQKGVHQSFDSATVDLDESDGDALDNGDSIDKGELIDTSPNHPGAEKPVVQNPVVKPLIANRLYVFGIFLSVFGEEIRNYVTDKIAWSPNEFGMAMSLYNRDYRGDCSQRKSALTKCNYSENAVRASHRQGFNTRRAGIRLKVCNYAVNNEGALNHALAKISGEDDTPQLNRQNLEKMMHLFYRGKKLSFRIIDKLEDLANEQQSPQQAWRVAIKSTCMSPHWQVL